LLARLQYGEIWPTGGWGSIEYGTVGYTPGQVQGGRWKPLQYFYERYLFRDVLVACSSDGRCLVKNDNALAPVAATAAFAAVHLATGLAVPLATVPVALPVGAGAAAWACLDGSNDTAKCPAVAAVLASVGCTPASCVVTATVTATPADRRGGLSAGPGALLAENLVLCEVPANLTLPAARVTTAVGAPQPDGTVPVTVTSDATALFVHLTSAAQGRFSVNSFPVWGAGSVTVSYIPFGAATAADAGVLAASLRVEHLGQYL